MSKRIPSYLRLHVEPLPASPTSVDAYPPLVDLCTAFEQATGWVLRYLPGTADPHDPELLWSAPLGAGPEAASGHLRIDLNGTSSSGRPVDVEAAVALATALAELVGELLRTQYVVWQQEAELAAGVPVTASADEAELLAHRLEGALRAGAEAIGCHAAGLYLLDVHTTELKLRSAWGLPRRKLQDPPRPLPTATADLEALAGHAVVLERRSAALEWNAPEAFPAAVCVPVATSSVPLGTLWLFCEEERAFSDQEVNVAEVVAGRLAVELERQVLLGEGQSGAQLKRQLVVGQQLQQNQLPRVIPCVEGWDVAGWASQADSLGGAFFDWLVTPEGALGVAVGRAEEAGIGGALVAQSIRTAMRLCGEQSLNPPAILARISRLLWTGSAGEQTGSLCYTLADATSGRLVLAAAGQPRVLRLRPGHWEELVEPGLLLGVAPEAEYRAYETTLAPGDVLVIYDHAIGELHGREGAPLLPGQLAPLLMGSLSLPAAEIARRLRAQLESLAEVSEHDLAALVLQRL